MSALQKEHIQKVMKDLREEENAVEELAAETGLTNEDARIFMAWWDQERKIKSIENWLKYHPEDLQSELILGEFHYRNQDDEKAMEIWNQFRKTKLTKY